MNTSSSRNDSALDRFYTPPAVAERLAAPIAKLHKPVCVDPSCGRGSLLDAVEGAARHVSCLGLDRDRAAVEALRNARPTWTVSVGDMLDARSVSRSKVYRSGRRIDAIVTNPPFSMRGKRVVEVATPSGVTRCSIAAAHLLAAIEHFRPQSVVSALLPESFLHSDLDALARRAISRNWSFSCIEFVGRDAFHGAHANAAIVHLRPGEAPTLSQKEANASHVVTCQVIRGGLPVHEFESNRTGLRFVHTVDFLTLRSRPQALERATPIKRGIVSGNLVLLPRVGAPRLEELRPIEVRSPIQLSDCVIALRFASRKDAERGARLLWKEFEILVGIYRGTGARYTTVDKLVRWLTGVGISASVIRSRGN